MLTVGLLGALAGSRQLLERSSPTTAVQWVDPVGVDGPIDLWLRIAGDTTTVPPSVNAALTATLDRVPEPPMVDAVLQQALASIYGFIVGYSDGMHQVCRWIQVLAHPMTRTTDVRALIVGQTGVGKELVASAVHRLGRHAGQPFVAINCGALPRELIVSELFGHSRGAFTGATSSRPGLLEQAQDGVVFLDEIGELPVELQPALLRVLEERAFRPLGSDSQHAFRAQVISATNRDAATLVERGIVRADLYFRLAHVVVPVPSLSERAGDLPLLVRELWRRVDDSEPPEDLVTEAAQRAWPGNIRELRHAVERVALLRRTIGLRSLNDAVGPVAAEQPVETGTLAELRSRFERDVVISVLRRCGGDVRAVARELGITQRSVYNLIKRHRLTLGK